MKLTNKLLMMPLSVLTFSVIFFHASNAVGYSNPRVKAAPVAVAEECVEVETSEMSLSRVVQKGALAVSHDDAIAIGDDAADKPKPVFAKFCWGKKCYGGRDKGKDPTCTDGGECDQDTDPKETCMAWMTEIPGPTPNSKVKVWNCGCSVNGKIPSSAEPIPAATATAIEG